MQREIYSITGENSQGEEVAVLTVGFDANDKPLAAVGENEVSLDDVISAPSGGTAGQVLTKTNTGCVWADTGSGLPSTANAGDAMIYNGTEWTKQSGYGYHKDGNVTTIDWDGSLTGQETIGDLEVDGMVFRKVLSTVIPDNELLNMAWTFGMSEDDISFVDYVAVNIDAITEDVPGVKKVVNMTEMEGMAIGYSASVTAQIQLIEDGPTYTITPGLWSLARLST